jgi:ribose-phosphate pyrophosphokinase
LNRFFSVEISVEGVCDLTEDILIFGGSGSPKLTRNICGYLGVEAGKAEVIQFSEGNTYVRVQEKVRGRRIYLIQSTVFPANDNFMELLFWIDALKRADAKEITLVMPYFSYAKGDKLDEPGVSVRAHVCAKTLELIGIKRLIILDIHAPQIHGFFNIPIYDLHAIHALCKVIKNKKLPDLIVVSPDSGYSKQARKYAKILDTPIAFAEKERKSHDERASIQRVIGDVRGKTALIVDDFIISGRTLIGVAEMLLGKGAKAVFAVVSHGVFGVGTIERLDNSPIQAVIITDSVENQPEKFSKKIEVVGIAQIIGDTIRTIHRY